MLKIEQWNFEECINNICRVREYKVSEQLRADLITELKKLNFHGWNHIETVVEKIMGLGKQALNENLWNIVRTAVKDRIDYVKSQSQSSQKPVEVKKTFSENVFLSIDTEISTWLNFAPPLEFRGVPVVRRSKFWCQDGTDGRDLDDWVKCGKPELRSVLDDTYSNIFVKGLHDEEVNKDENILVNMLRSFYKELVASRKEQVAKRSENAKEEALEKLKLIK